MKQDRLSRGLPVEKIKYELDSYLQAAYDQVVRWKKNEILKSGKQSPLASLPGS